MVTERAKSLLLHYTQHALDKVSQMEACFVVFLYQASVTQQYIQTDKTRWIKTLNLVLTVLALTDGSLERT